MIRNQLLTLFCIFSVLSAKEKQNPTEHFERERTYHVVHYRLNLELDELAKTCIGDVSIKLVPLRTKLDTVRIDAGEMNIDRVTMNGRPLDFHQTGETLFVAMQKLYVRLDTLTLDVSYRLSSPKKGIYFIQPDSGSPEHQWQIWTQGENLDNHYWFPCYDFPNDKSTSEMIVTVNDRFTAISNGKLIDVKHDREKHKATYHWFEGKPHSSYLISLVVGEYVDLKDAWGQLPISNYVYKSQKDVGMLSFSKTPKMIEFFSRKIGYTYPWEKFAQTVVHDFMFGGMENVSAVTLTDWTIHDERAHLTESSDGLVAHELAHQWWGDLLTCRDWSHAWLNEGFATYFDILFQEYDKGHDEAEKMILDTQQGLVVTDVAERRRPTVWNRYVNPMELFDNHIYGKGACVLHMLRFILGDDLFWKSMNHYAHKFAFQNVETNDLKVAIEEATGYNLYWFFDEWLYKAGYPELFVRSSWNEATKSLQLSVRQTQTVDSLTGIFRTPVDVEVWVDGMPHTYRITLSQVEDQYSFPAASKPQLVIFDKGSWILKKVDFEKTPDEWIFQLNHATEGVDRILAIRGFLGLVDSANVTEALAKAAASDPFWDVRRNAVYTLAGSKKSETVDRIVQACRDKDARVRQAAVGALGNFKGDKVVATLKDAFEHDSSYSVAASALSMLAKVDSANVKTYCSAALQRTSHHEIIRSTALRVLSGLGDEDALSTITSFSKYGNDQNLRVECLGLLGRVWKQRTDVVDYLITVLHDPSVHVRRAAIDILGSLGDKRAIEPLEESAARETDARLAKSAQDSIERIQEAQH